MLQIAQPQIYFRYHLLQVTKTENATESFEEWLYFDARMKGLVVLRRWVQVKHSITTVER